MANNRLTSLAAVKNWASVSSSADDVLLNRLIDSCSRFILSYLQRPSLFQQNYSDVYDGVGNRAQVLRHWPVLSVSSVTVGMQAIAALQGLQTACGSGYVLDPWDGFPPGRPQAITLRGYEFCRGYSNVSIGYTAGFVVQNEAQTVPDTCQVIPSAPNGSYALDQGVSYANGTPLTPVTGTPAAGQYVPPDLSGPEPFYQFASADAGQQVLISYSYVPSDIEQACMELVGERYNAKSRIGYVSKSLGGQETVTFTQKNMGDYVSSLLLPYKRVI